MAAERAALAAAAAPKLRARGKAPGNGWCYGQVRAWRQYACAGGAKGDGVVAVDVNIGLQTTSSGAALHVVVERTEDADAPCSFSGEPSGLVRISYQGASKVQGARRVYRFTSWRSGVLPSGHDELTTTESGTSTLVLDCGEATVSAHAYEADDDRENSAGFLASELPSVSVISCTASGVPIEHALFEQWTYQGQLLLAPEPGVELRSALYDGMDGVLALRVGSTAPAYALPRKRVGVW